MNNQCSAIGLVSPAECCDSTFKNTFSGIQIRRVENGIEAKFSEQDIWSKAELSKNGRELKIGNHLVKFTDPIKLI